MLLHQQLLFPLRPLRVYEQVWKNLKVPPHICILEVVDEEFVPRIKRMVMKEKDMDLGFKVINEVEKFRLKFSWCKERMQLTVELTAKYGVVEIKR